MKKKILLLVSSVVLSLILIEISLHALNYPPRRDQFALLRHNPHGTGSFRLKPNHHATHNNKGMIIKLDTNSQGMAWREVSVEKPAGKKRICFLGDSFTMGQWAKDLDHGFVGVFDKSFVAAHNDYEVLNFGTSGYGFQEMALQLKEDVIRFSPDMVVIASYNGNDFRDAFLGMNRFNVDTGKAIWNPEVFEKVPAPFRPEGIRTIESEEHPGFIGRTRRALSNHVNLYRLMGMLDEPNFFGTTSHESANPINDFLFTNDFNQPCFWSRTSTDNVLQQAASDVEAALSDIAAFCRQRNIELVVMAIPYLEQVTSKQEKGDFYDISLPQSYLKSFCAKKKIPYLDLLPMLRQQVRTTNEDIFLRGDIHLNDRGHGLVGQELNRFLSDLKS